MEYIFGYEPRYGEVLKVKSPNSVDLEHGMHTVERDYSDQNITDGFFVEKEIRPRVVDGEGNNYAWYQITNHYRYSDKFTPGIKSTEQEITDLEIEGMEQEQCITDLEIEIMEINQELHPDQNNQ